MCCCVHSVFYYSTVDLRVLHVRTHSFPTRRSSGLQEPSSSTALLARARQRWSCAATRLLWTASSFRTCVYRTPMAQAFAWSEAIWRRSEEHTSELQSLMRISYAVFCLKKKNQKKLTVNSESQYRK